MVQTIKVHAREIESGKQKFISCSANINDSWYKIKFTKSCENAPKHKGLYDVTFETKTASIEKGKPYTNKNGKKGVDNPTIWIKEMVKIRAYTDEDYERENENAFAEIFSSDDLPF